MERRGSEVKRIMGQEGPRVSEKWRIRGRRVVSGRVSMMAAKRSEAGRREDEEVEGGGDGSDTMKGEVDCEGGMGAAVAMLSCSSSAGVGGV